MDRTPIEGVLSKCLKRFIVSEVNSESEQARRLNPCNLEQYEVLNEEESSRFCFVYHDLHLGRKERCS
jgi:hypothetical protein